MRKRRSVVIAGVALVASGCFAGGAEQPADGQRLRVAFFQPPRTGLSPLSDDAFKLSRLGVSEPLVTLDRDGQPRPLLATSWTRLDERSWRFDIRPGVRFHDGTELTAPRVAGALNRAAQASPPPRILDGVELDAQVAGTSVTVRTAQPDPLVPQRLSSPQLAIFAEAAYAADGRVNPVRTGTGPFVLTAVNGSASATADRNDHYWGGRARASGIDATFVPDGSARAAALRSGTADIVEAIPASQAPLLDEGTFREVPMPRTNTLYLNTRRGAFTDPALRAAAREALDPAALVRDVYEGRADQAKGLLGPAIPWASERPSRPVRPAAPAQGRKIVLATFSDRAELPEVAATIAQQFERRGFVVEQVVREYAAIEADALAGAFDAFILSRATLLDSGDPVAYLTSDFTCAGGFNLAGLCDPAVDKAVTEAAAVADPAHRRTAILRAEAAVLGTDAVVPLLHERVLQGNAPGVTDAAFDPRERELVTIGTHKR